MFDQIWHIHFQIFKACEQDPMLLNAGFLKVPGNVVCHVILWNIICDFQVDIEMKVKTALVYCTD